MEKEKLIELEKRELGMLEEFLSALKDERDAIISFSLEGIIRENNRKEEILKKLEFIEIEKDKIHSSESPDALEVPIRDAEFRRLLGERIEKHVGEVKVALEKNMRLLSFSMDHVKSSLEKIIEFINRASYEKGRSISIMVSRKV
jgi:hypothetical protein